MTTKNNRYTTVSTGIRKDTISKKFYVTKSVNGKRYHKQFDRLKESKLWHKTFNPVEEIVHEKTKVKNEEHFLFRDLWNRYRDEHLSTLEKSTLQNRDELSKFFKGLWDYNIYDITAEVVTNHIRDKKEISLKIGSKGRLSFTHELKLLRAIFNWYHDVFDYKYHNPVTRRHNKLGIVRKKDTRKKKMNHFELMLFFNTLIERPFWHDFALTQFMFASRVQEIAGLQKVSVNLFRREAIIKDVVIWDKSTKKFERLKPMPKNGEIRAVYLTDDIFDIMKRRLQHRPENPYVFHLDGEIPTYRQIIYNYDWALKKAGLNFSGTHILRHSMATMTRMVTGSLEATQAVTGHKDQRLVQHYAAIDSDANKNALTLVEDFLKERSS